MIKKYLAIMVIGTSNFAYAAAEQSSFLIKKHSTENIATLSKDGIKERMGEAVREAIHSLFDNAATIVQTQRSGMVPLSTTCVLHEKIIALQRKLSRVAESLIDGHFVYKKNHKKRLEASLVVLRFCAQECKDANSKLQAQAATELQKNVEAVTMTFTRLESKLAKDICLKTI